MHKKEDGLLRIRMKSRHASSKTYQLLIKYEDGDIVAWYCKCRVGLELLVCAPLQHLLFGILGLHYTCVMFIVLVYVTRESS